MEKPAQKRDKELKAFSERQAVLRKRREKLLEAEGPRLEKQRQNELDQFIKREEQKSKKLERDLLKQVAPTKRQIAEKTRRWEQHSKPLESLRSKRAAVRGSQGHPGSWRHMVQPVWSLYPLWVRFSSIHTRLSFAPDQVPLSRSRDQS